MGDFVARGWWAPDDWADDPEPTDWAGWVETLGRVHVTPPAPEPDTGRSGQ